jgi:hypothetical protein
LKREIIKNIVLLCSSIVIWNYGLSQENDTTVSQSDIYYVSYSEKLSLYTYGISKFSNFEVKDTLLNKKIKYAPNSNFNIGIGFNYKWLGLAVAFNFDFINNADVGLYGETESFDIQAEVYSEKIFFSGNFQIYKGYYWANPNVFYPDWSKKDSLVKKPTLTTANLALNGFYVLNHEQFSLKSSITGTERQLKSAGSWLAGYKASIYAIADSGSLVPDELVTWFPNALDIASLTTINIGGSMGYTYTFVFKEYYFLNALLMLGFNVQVINVKNIYGEQIGADGRLSTNGTFRFGIGCNKEKYYYGLSYNTDSYSIVNPNKTELNYNYGKFRIYYGRRFNLKDK